MRRKKEISQNEGINQIALNNSNKNEITIINTPTEYMSYLIKKGKIQDAVEVFAKVYEQTEKLHPLYPLYVYKPIKIGSQVVFEHRPANEQIAQQFPLQFKGKFTIKHKDIEEDETLGEYINRKYFSQEKIKIDMKYLETWIGEQLIDDSISIEQHAVKDGQWYIVPTKLPKLIRVKLVLTEKVDRVIIDYLELRVTKINNKENKITISNVHQINSPVIISLTVPNILRGNKRVDTSKFNIMIREGFEGNVVAEKTFLEFMKYSADHSKLSLVNIESQNLFFAAESVNVDTIPDLQDIDDRIKILSELSKIESELKAQFCLPELITKEDFEKIDTLKAIIENREIISKIDHFSSIFDDKAALEQLITDIKDSPIMITAKETQSIELFGVQFKDIQVEYKIENLVVKNADIIRKKLEYFIDGETIKVEFVPSTMNKLTIRYSYKT